MIDLHVRSRDDGAVERLIVLDGGKEVVGVAARQPAPRVVDRRALNHREHGLLLAGEVPPQRRRAARAGRARACAGPGSALRSRSATSTPRSRGSTPCRTRCACRRPRRRDRDPSSSARRRRRDRRPARSRAASDRCSGRRRRARTSGTSRNCRSSPRRTRSARRLRRRVSTRRCRSSPASIPSSRRRASSHRRRLRAGVRCGSAAGRRRRIHVGDASRARAQRRGHRPRAACGTPAPRAAAIARWQAGPYFCVSCPSGASPQWVPILSDPAPFSLSFSLGNVHSVSRRLVCPRTETSTSRSATSLPVCGSLKATVPGTLASCSDGLANSCFSGASTLSSTMVSPVEQRRELRRRLSLRRNSRDGESRATTAARESKP